MTDADTPLHEEDVDPDPVRQFERWFAEARETGISQPEAGALATAGYGTALGVIRAAVEQGKKIHVYADETRPFLQGSRLTAWELMKDGIPTTVISDNMAGAMMSKGKIGAIVVGADRIAANGDVANKIGTYTVAVLAKEHGIPKIAVLEKGWIGSGNVGRNTTIVRSNYLLAGNIPLYELSLRLWEGLEQDLNYNVMVSQRGVLNLFHSDAQRDAFARRGNAMRIQGADAELLDHDGVRKLYPFLNFDAARFPIQGGLLQQRGGTVRHDAVAWGYARAADALGISRVTLYKKMKKYGLLKESAEV